jgi:ribosome-associated translation inhibitor RaiA
VFRGRSAAGTELLLLATRDGSFEAVVGGAAVAILDRADELEQTEPGLAFRLAGTDYRETFAVCESTLVELREALQAGMTPNRACVRELIEDGILDRAGDVTARGRRSLLLDRRPARRGVRGPRPEIVVRGPVPRRERARLEEALARLVDAAPRHVLHVRGSLERHEDPAQLRPAVAKATMQLDSSTVRAHVAAETEHEAIALLVARMRRKLRTVANRAVAARRGPAAADIGGQHRVVLPRPQPSYVLRPPAERRVLRRKTYASAPMTPEEAADEMALLDHDFHMFVDARSGEDTLVHARPDGSLALRRRNCNGASSEPCDIDPEPAATMSLGDAIAQLDTTDEPFEFFCGLRLRARRGSLSPVRRPLRPRHPRRRQARMTAPLPVTSVDTRAGSPP